MELQAWEKVNFVNSDFWLIRKMKQGEDEAFDEFVRKYYREVLTYCIYRCPDRAVAEDLTQETFVRFFTGLSRYHHRGKVKNYLYRVAGNLCRDYFKKVKETPVEEEELSGRIEFAESPMDAVSDKLTVEWALNQLPDELREVIALYYFQDLKLSEIAGILDISLSLVKYRMRQARTRLENLLEKEEKTHESGTTAHDV